MTISMARLSGKYIGQPFIACSCMRMVHDWYTDLGVDMPTAFDDLDLTSYFEAWQADKKAVTKKMFGLFDTLGVAADPTDLVRHDLLIVREQDNFYAAIYMGDGLVMASHIDEGVKLIHLGRNHQVSVNRRMIPCPH